MSERRPQASAPLDGAVLAVLALAVIGWLAPRVAGFTTDSDAYLDVARSVRAGTGLVQSVVDFWRPGVPDPLALWPPLYPLLVAVVAAFGVPLELAARFVAAGSFAVFAFAFHALAVTALGRGGGALATIAALATLSVTRLGAFAWSEATFLALTTIGLAMLARAESAGGWTRGRAFVAGVAFGLAAVTRYAGVPVALAAVAYVALRPALRGDGGRALRSFALQSLALPGVGIARNLLLFGRPFGPALPPAEHGVATQAFELARALRWELLPAPFDRVEALGDRNRGGDGDRRRAGAARGRRGPAGRGLRARLRRARPRRDQHERDQRADRALPGAGAAVPRAGRIRGLARPERRGRRRRRAGAARWRPDCPRCGRSPSCSSCWGRGRRCARRRPRSSPAATTCAP